MAQEILVNVTPQETRVASIENGVPQEFVVERSSARGLVGNIYLGRVSRVLPGMGAAFLDIGLARTAFLHVSDLYQSTNENSLAEIEIPIEQSLSEGQQLLVQVAKDPLGTKGARLTTSLSISSRYLVYMPRTPTVGISQRIESDDERQRLRNLLEELAPYLTTMPTSIADTSNQKSNDSMHNESGIDANRGGYIARTAAEGATKEKLRDDMHFLQQLWQSISANINGEEVPSLIFEDLPLVLRMIRDVYSINVEKIRIDSKETYTKVAMFAKQFTPELVPRIEHYLEDRPILDLYSTENEIERALQPKVELGSGGHLIIDQTEAMTTIDVNTGGFVGHRKLEETILKTNIEASHVIARQLRLRNLGGIIIVDFIDMSNEEHQCQVLRTLENSLARDHSRTTISEITSLGLVQITRKRTRESLEHVLCEECPTCDGRGSIKSAQSVCYEILREILRGARQHDAQKLKVVASKCVVDILLREESSSVLELEEFIRIPIGLEIEATYTREQYDVVLL